MKKKQNLFIINFFILFIFGGLLLSIVIPDKDINQIENKILQKFEKPKVETLLSGKFMDSFDEYVSDQFPLRNTFIKIKNSFEYLIGKREFKNVYFLNNRYIENFALNKDILKENILNINNLIENTNLNTKILLVPTSAAFYEELLPSYSNLDNQIKILQDLNNYFGESFYNIYDILKFYKNEYIYFNTDHHWTQLAAKYVFEYIFEKEINENPKLISKNFLGSYYSKGLLPFVKPDHIYSYEYFKDFYMEYDLVNKTNTLYDDNKLHSKNKYQYFLNGDPGYAIIYGDGKEEVLVLKDSFAHVFIPFLTKEYYKIHIIDPRYYKVDIEKYLKENKSISELIIMNNLSTLNSELIY